MNTYDPEKPPNAADWMNLDEGERIDLVESYHRRHKIRLPNLRIHSVIHVVVENQLALREELVVATLARLQEEGLDRHEALHAIGSVLAKHLFAILKGEVQDRGEETNREYFEGLKRITAESWRTFR